MSTAISRSKEAGFHQRNVKTATAGRTSTTCLSPALFSTLIFLAMGNLSSAQTLTTPGASNSSAQTATTPGTSNASVHTSATSGANNSTVHTSASSGATSGANNSTVHTSASSGATSGANNSTVHTSASSGASNSSVHTSATSGASNSSAQTSTTSGASNSSAQTATTSGGSYTSVHTPTTSGGTNSVTNMTFTSTPSSGSASSSTSSAYGSTTHNHQTSGSTIMISICTIPNINGGIALPSSAGKTVVISCFSGFSLQGTSALHCVGGSWDAPIPTCSRQSYSKSDVKNEIKFNNVESKTPLWLLWTLCAVFGLLGLLFLSCALYICSRMCGCVPDPIWGQVHPSGYPSRRVGCACCRTSVVDETGQTPHHVDTVGDHTSGQSLHRTGNHDTNRKLMVKVKKKQRAKNVLTWLPHKFPVRDINTSTK